MYIVYSSCGNGLGELSINDLIFKKVYMGQYHLTHCKQISLYE